MCNTGLLVLKYQKKNYYINDGAVMVKCEVHLLAKASRTLGTTHFQNNEVNFKTVINKQ